MGNAGADAGETHLVELPDGTVEDIGGDDGAAGHAHHDQRWAQPAGRVVSLREGESVCQSPLPSSGGRTFPASPGPRPAVVEPYETNPRARVQAFVMPPVGGG